MRTAAEAVRTQLNVVTGELERYFPQVNTTPLHSATNITAFANFPATQRALSNIPMTCEHNRTLAWPGTACTRKPFSRDPLPAPSDVENLRTAPTSPQEGTNGGMRS